VPRSEAIRDEIHRLIRATPFRRFILILESGDRVLIEHPENIAFDPDAKEPGHDEFDVITGRIRMSSTFGAVSNVAMADREGAAA
jgi:hypothetical protein